MSLFKNPKFAPKRISEEVYYWFSWKVNISILNPFVNSFDTKELLFANSCDKSEIFFIGYRVSFCFFLVLDTLRYKIMV